MTNTNCHSDSNVSLGGISPHGDTIAKAYSHEIPLAKREIGMTALLDINGNRYNRKIVKGN